MKIKMKVSMASFRTSYTPGQEYEFPADEAQRLIDAGFAEAVPEGKKPSKAKKAAPSKRTRRTVAPKETRA